jgi:hypothetical protein
MSIKIFYHICAINNWDVIVDSQLTKIHNSGLYNEVEVIYVNIVGEDANKCVNFIKDYGDKIKILKVDVNDKSYERLTLLNIKQYITPEDKILYIHSKGVTKPNNIYVELWRDYLEYFNIYGYKKCLFVLDQYDICGCNISSTIKFHYSGNFWWSTGKYYLTLPDTIDDNYTSPEFYIVSNNPKMASLHNQKNPNNLYNYKYYKRFYM